MQVLTAIIIDDEEKSRKVLRKLITQLCPEIKVIGEAGTIDEAYAAILKLNPQLVFLDIQMPTGTGFSLLEKLKKFTFDVIFVTGFDQYAINAIKFSALDYLLKPVDTGELKTSVERALNSARIKEDRQVQMINLLNNIDPAVKEKRIGVHHHEKVVFIKLSDIMYIEADDRYSLITTVQNETYTLAKTLKDFEDFLSVCQSFIRTSRNLIVNTGHIKSYTKDQPCMITMLNEKNFEIPRRRKQEVLEMLKR